MSELNLVVILGTVRAGRLGARVARYVVDACQKRGHRVTMITSEPFRDVAERNGLEFVRTLSTVESNAVMTHPDLWNPKKGLRVILDTTLMDRNFPVIF